MPDVRAALLEQLDRFTRKTRAHFRNHAAELPLRGAELRLLISVWIHGPLSLSELAEAMSVTRPMISLAARRLIDLGYAELVTDEHDRRRRMLRLAAKGRALARTLEQKREQWLMMVLAELTAQEQETLLVLLEKLNKGHWDES